MNNPNSVELGRHDSTVRGVAVQTNVKPPISFRPSPEELEGQKQSPGSSASTHLHHSHSDHSTQGSTCEDEGCSTDHSHGGESHHSGGHKKHKKEKKGRLDYRRLTAANGGIFGPTIRVFQVFNIIFYFVVR